MPHQRLTKTALDKENDDVGPANIHVAHHVPGRTRFDVPMARGNDHVAHLFREIARSIPGVYDVRTSNITGSVVFHYHKHDSDVRERLGKALRDADRLLSLAMPEAEEIVQGVEALEPEAELLASRFPAARPLVSSLKRADREIRKATGGAVDLNTLLPLVLGLGILLLDTKRREIVLGVLALVSLHAYITFHAPERIS